MIKAEELSIGDWVNVLNYHWDGSPYSGQVNGITKKHGTYYLQFSSALSAEIDRCEPIPITKEILEKNGFSGEMYAIFKIDEHIWLEYCFSSSGGVMQEGWCMKFRKRVRKSGWCSEFLPPQDGQFVQVIHPSS